MRDIRVQISLGGAFLESPEKPFVKLRPTYSVKLFFWYIVKEIKIKIKFHTSKRLRFEDTKKIMSTEKSRDSRETGRWPVLAGFIFKLYHVLLIVNWLPPTTGGFMP